MCMRKMSIYNKTLGAAALVFAFGVAGANAAAAAKATTLASNCARGVIKNLLRGSYGLRGLSPCPSGRIDCPSLLVILSQGTPRRPPREGEIRTGVRSKVMQSRCGFS